MKNNLKQQLFILITLCVIAFSSANADLMPIESLFKQMDQDKDGYIERNEINKQSLLATQFDKADKNKDGNLDNREFEVFIASADI